MKTLKRILILFAVTALFTACEKNEHFWGEGDPGRTMKDATGKSVAVMVPLRADFSVVPEGIFEDDSHEEYSHKLIMVGEGTISHLGKMSTRMEFFANAGAVGLYGYGTGIFVAANGDELYFEFDDGLIIWNEMENADFYLTRFNDEMFFTGGTGRFDGAAGSMWSNAFVHYPASADDYWHTDFFSYGDLVLLKGKR